MQHAIAATLPPGVEVVTGQTVADEQTNAINQALGFFSTALLVFAFIALFVGGFTIFNTFSIIVGQRTRELAMLRIVGASRGQVFRSVLAEAAIVGLVASALGLGLGVLGAIGLEKLLSGFGITLPSRLAGVRRAHRRRRPGRRRRRDGGLGHQPGPPGRPHPAGGRHRRAEPGRRGVVRAAASSVGSIVTVVGIGVLALGSRSRPSSSSGSGRSGIFVGVGMLAPVGRPTHGQYHRAPAGRVHSGSPAASGGRIRCAAPAARRRRRPR